jgi:PAS domain-containing protein
MSATKEYTNGPAAPSPEAAMQDSEARYRLLFETCPDGILIADPETKIITCANPAACRMLELKQQINELCRQMDRPLMHPLDFLDAESPTSAAAETASPKGGRET